MGGMELPDTLAFVHQDGLVQPLMEPITIITTLISQSTMPKWKFLTNSLEHTTHNSNPRNFIIEPDCSNQYH
jgi:hypothetical protein